MGQCGCADFNVQYKFKGPNNTFYLLCVYDSCEYCQTGVAVILYKMSYKECQHWGIEDIPITELTSEGKWIPILDPEILGEMVGKSYTEDEIDADLIRETVWSKFQDAILKTRENDGMQE